MDTFNERSTILVTVAWFDADDAAVTPTTAAYRVDDVRSGVNIVASTSIGSLSTTNTIEITPAQNTVLDYRREFEQHAVTVTFTFGAGGTRAGTARYVYAVNNLPKVDSPDVSASASVSPSASTSPSASRSPSVSASSSASPSA